MNFYLSLVPRHLTKNQRGEPGIHCSHMHKQFLHTIHQDEQAEFADDAMCSYTMQKRSLQVRNGDMPLLPFQSGCEARIQTVRLVHVYLPYLSVAIQTHPCCIDVLIAISCSSFSAILGFPTIPRAHNMALLNKLGCM